MTNKSIKDAFQLMWEYVLAKVPVAKSTDRDKFLRGDGTWADIQSGGVNMILSEKEPSNLFEGDYWNRLLTTIAPPDEMVPCIVSLVRGEGYDIVPANGSSSKVYKGDNYSFTVSIRDGYRTTSSFAVKVNGTTVTASNGVYTITNILVNQTITVVGVEVTPAVLTITGTGNATYCYATVNGTKQSGAASNIEVQTGSTITFGVYGYSSTYPGWVKVNGAQIINVTDKTTKTTTWTVPDGVQTISMSMSYTSTTSQRRGQITVTTK